MKSSRNTNASIAFRVRKLLRNFIWFVTPRIPRIFDDSRSMLRKRALLSIQEASYFYKWDGVRCIKNPFDLALYTMLLSQLRPRTIIEIGSASGGSGLWLGGQSKALGLDAQVFSFDISPVEGRDRDNVTFGLANIENLGESNIPAILAQSERPLLIIEDGPHTYEGCLAALEFFDDYLAPGDYIVVEDGILRDLGYWRYRNGPNRAIKTFLKNRPDRYVIDREFCDFWGPNFTWNTNGYLKRI